MIYCNNLKKYFKKNIKEPGLKGSFKSLFKPNIEIVRAVDDVSFHVSKGEILGFIGPNGAGKSTVIKMLTGILTPTSGVCKINGHIPQEERTEYVKDIGVVFGQRTQLWWDLPLNETYTVLKEIYRVSDDSYKKRMSFLNEVLELDKFIKSPVRTLSLGQRIRADIAASLLHSPKVLFLDEPTIGLDVVVKDNIRKAISLINKEDGTTVILTTHDISDIELLCKRIVMIDNGKKVFDGELELLKNKYGQIRKISFELKDENDIFKIDYHDKFNLNYEDLILDIDDKIINIKYNTDKVSTKNIINYTLSNINVRDITVKEAAIEEIVRRLYKEGVNIDT